MDYLDFLESEWEKDKINKKTNLSLDEYIEWANNDNTTIYPVYSGYGE